MLSDDSDVEDIHLLTINEHYAKAFEYHKEREELAKLKDKYGSDVGDDDEDEEDSEELESEDEDGEELTPAVDAAILRTLARIKRKDPSIYEQGKDVFEEEVQKTGDAKIFRRSSEDKSKPLTMRQHILASTLNPSSRSPSPEPLTHVQEQEALRKETIAAFHTAADAEGEDDFLVPREKTKDELQREEEEYKEYLQREVGEDLKGLITIESDSLFAHDDGEEPNGGIHKDQGGAEEKKQKEKKPKKSGKSKEEDNQEFLLNYILNRGWIDRSAKRLPTYKEITSRGSKGKGKARDDEGSEGSDADEGGEAGSGRTEENEFDEEEFDEVVDRFESSYNFRFEEPGADKIPRYPRNIGSLVRREDSSRKEAREKRKTRKEEELLKKKEEVKRLKALKMKEIHAKLERIGLEGGKKLEETRALEDLDLEGDWDPDAHDKQMAAIYGEDEGDDIDEERPHWDDDIDVADIVTDEDDEDESSKKKKKKKKKKNDVDIEEEGGVDVDEMDADIERIVDDEEWDGTEEMRKRKLEEYMDEVYGMDFNDIVAGIPTRFKYTKVQSQSFALTPAEILLATDTELNQYMGLKKYAPYRKEGSNWDKNRVARLRELKTKIAERRKAFEAGGNAAPSSLEREKPTKKRKGKKERMREKVEAVQHGAGEDGEELLVDDAQEKGDGKRKRETDSTLGHNEGEEEERWITKKRRRHKKSAQKGDDVPS